tara:strand:+ start:107 stop:502 length:396 start_codon:yes stop_codon:yes gene_type:complete
MAHFAELNENNIVLRVIVVSNEDEINGEDFCNNLLGGRWKQTSYNTRGGVHYDPETGMPDGGVAFRKNYAGVGHIFDEERDAFRTVRQYLSWTLNEDTCYWEPPIPKPSPDSGGYYEWDEPTVNWVYIPYS